jgi:CheY-like chemotaxis protein
MRDYVLRLLSVRYDVEAVADGKAALVAARTCRPDLVLADVMIPQLDGFGVLRALRAGPWNASGLQPKCSSRRRSCSARNWRP